MRPEALEAPVCPISADLERLGFASRHDLGILHARCHAALARIVQGRSCVSKPPGRDNAGWPIVEEAHLAFLEAILAVYRNRG